MWNLDGGLILDPHQLFPLLLPFFLAFVLLCYSKLHLLNARYSFGVMHLHGLPTHYLLLAAGTLCNKLQNLRRCWLGHTGSSLLIFLLSGDLSCGKWGQLSCTIILQ